MNLYKSRITSKGQITIPKQIRDAIALYEKDEILFEQHENHIILKPALKNIGDLVGIMKTAEKPYDKKQERELRGRRRGEKHAAKNTAM